MPEVYGAGGELVGYTSDDVEDAMTGTPQAQVIPIRPTVEECVSAVEIARDELTQAKKDFYIDEAILNDSKARLDKAKQKLGLALHNLKCSLLVD